MGCGMQGYWNNRNKRVALAAIALLAVYFPLARWLQTTYVSRPGASGDHAIRLTRPFEHYGGSGSAFIAGNSLFNSFSDTLKALEQSPVLLYEGNKLLGPAHSSHTDIAEQGGGRYSHWQDYGVVFSASDGTNPNQNGRIYWLVLPSGSVK
jgi:hypothetical protein